MSELTPERRAENMRLKEAATAGPWEVERAETIAVVCGDLSEVCNTGDECVPGAKEDAAYIVAACNDLPLYEAALAKAESRQLFPDRFAMQVTIGLQADEIQHLRKSVTFIREGLAAWLDNAQNNRQRMDKELIVGCLERLIVDADQALKGPT